MGFSLIFWSLWLLSVGIIYVVEERRGRRHWRDVAAGTAPAFAGEVGPYRPTATVPVMLRRAPRALRWIALSSLLLGWMAIPGGLLGLFGLLAGGLGLISIPGMIAAVKLFGAGLALLRRDTFRALARVESAVAWELWLNGIVAGLSLIFVIGSIGVHSRDVRAIGAFVVVLNLYGAISVGQALLLRAITRRHASALASAP